MRIAESREGNPFPNLHSAIAPFSDGLTPENAGPDSLSPACNQPRPGYDSLFGLPRTPAPVPYLFRVIQPVAGIVLQPRANFKPYDGLTPSWRASSSFGLPVTF